MSDVTLFNSAQAVITDHKPTKHMRVTVIHKDIFPNSSHSCQICDTPLHMTRAIFTPSILAISLLFLATTADSDQFKSPDILILGDSQITFGAGPAYLSFFSNLRTKCALRVPSGQMTALKDLKTVAVIGVRSTALREWASRTRSKKADICDIDPNLRKNAGAFGTVNLKREKYVQMGIGSDFQFCKPDTSPLEAALHKDYYEPKLLVLSFLGNAANDWAGDPAVALSDVSRTIAQIPADMPCVFMTTAPTFQSAANALRLKSQQNIKAAFAKTGNRCVFVDGITRKSLRILTQDKRNFRIRESGEVKDPFHPTHQGAKRFLKSIQGSICKAIVKSRTKR